MFVTEFGSPYRTSGLRPISIAMFDLIYAGKFEGQYIEKNEGYKGQSFKPDRTCYPALDFVKNVGSIPLPVVGEEPEMQPSTKMSKLSLVIGKSRVRISAEAILHQGQLSLQLLQPRSSQM